MENLTVAARIASLLQAIENCEKTENTEWRSRHRDTLSDLIKQRLPHGSGFDAGTRLEDASTADRLVFSTEFHHMNDVGFYDGWTDHLIIVTPTFTGFDIRVSGKDRNGIEDYIADTFHYALSASME